MVQCELRQTSGNESPEVQQAPFGEFTSQVAGELVSLAILVGDLFEEHGRTFCEEGRESLLESAYSCVMDGLNSTGLAAEYARYIQKRFMDGYNRAMNS